MTNFSFVKVTENGSRIFLKYLLAIKSVDKEEGMVVNHSGSFGRAN